MGVSPGRSASCRSRSAPRRARPPGRAEQGLDVKATLRVIRGFYCRRSQSCSGRVEEVEAPRTCSRVLASASADAAHAPPLDEEQGRADDSFPRKAIAALRPAKVREHSQTLAWPTAPSLDGPIQPPSQSNAATRRPSRCLFRSMSTSSVKSMSTQPKSCWAPSPGFTHPTGRPGDLATQLEQSQKVHLADELYVEALDP